MFAVSLVKLDNNKVSQQKSTATPPARKNATISTHGSMDLSAEIAIFLGQGNACSLPYEIGLRQKNAHLDRTSATIQLHWCMGVYVTIAIPLGQDTFAVSLMRLGCDKVTQQRKQVPLFYSMGVRIFLQNRPFFVKETLSVKASTSFRKTVSILTLGCLHLRTSTGTLALAYLHLYIYTTLGYLHLDTCTCILTFGYFTCLLTYDTLAMVISNLKVKITGDRHRRDPKSAHIVLSVQGAEEFRHGD